MWQYSERLITCRTLNKWYICKRRSLIGRPRPTCTYATADWLSAVDGEYKRPTRQRCLQSACGGGSWGTDRQIKTNSKPEILHTRHSLSSPSSFAIFVFLCHTRLCHTRHSLPYSSSFVILVFAILVFLYHTRLLKFQFPNYTCQSYRI